MSGLVLMPPSMLCEVMTMAKRAEFCPDALVRSIIYKYSKDPEFVRWMFKAFGGDIPSSLAMNVIKFYEDNY